MAHLKKIDKKSKEMSAHEQAASEINVILGEKRGKLTLRKMLEHESSRIAGVNLDTEKKKIDVVLGGIKDVVEIFHVSMLNIARRFAFTFQFTDHLPIAAIQTYHPQNHTTMIITPFKICVQ